MGAEAGLGHATLETDDSLAAVEARRRPGTETRPPKPLRTMTTDEGRQSRDERKRPAAAAASWIRGALAADVARRTSSSLSLQLLLCCGCSRRSRINQPDQRWSAFQIPLAAGECAFLRVSPMYFVSSRAPGSPNNRNDQSAQRGAVCSPKVSVRGNSQSRFVFDAGQLGRHHEGQSTTSTN